MVAGERHLPRGYCVRRAPSQRGHPATPRRNIRTRPATPAPARPPRSAVGPDRSPCRGETPMNGKSPLNDPADSPPPLRGGARLPTNIQIGGRTQPLLPLQGAIALRNRHFPLVHFLHHRSDVPQRPLQHFVRRTVRLRDQPRKLLQLEFGVVQQSQQTVLIRFIQQIRHARRYQPLFGTVEPHDEHLYHTSPPTPAPVRPPRSAAGPDRCPCRGGIQTNGQSPGNIRQTRPSAVLRSETADNRMTPRPGSNDAARVPAKLGTRAD